MFGNLCVSEPEARPLLETDQEGAQPHLSGPSMYPSCPVVVVSDGVTTKAWPHLPLHSDNLALW